jgi:hypothetical protein
MMGHKEKLISGDEHDALRKAKKKWVGVFTFRPGQRARIKRRFWRRIRKLHNIINEES